MHKRILLLRISYWSGAVIDGTMVVPMLFPRIGGALFGLDHFNPANDYRYAMMVGAALMLGWTVLLIWADRKPLDRKGVIIITAIPVVVGLMGAGAFAVSSGFIKTEKMLPTWVLQMALLVMFVLSYLANSGKNSGQVNRAG
jgi:hypothetical protein